MVMMDDKGNVIYPEDLEPQQVEVSIVKHDGALIFGDKEQSSLACVYARYAMGDPCSVIATDLGCTEADVTRKMRVMPEKYDETKKARECFLNIRLRRSLSLVDAWNLRQLEDLIEGRLSVTSDVVKELGKIAKDIFNRLQLQEGKATEILKVEDKRMTIPELEAKIKRVKEAGDGISRD